MPDTTPEVHPTHAQAAKGMFSKDIGGFPVWVWLVIIGVGIGAVVLAKSGKFSGLLGGGTSNTSGSGLGLAIDPSTGLPYAVEGLVPAEANAGNGTGNAQPIGTTPPPPVPTPIQQQSPHPAPYYATDPRTGAPIFPKTGGVVPGNIQPPPGGIGPAVVTQAPNNWPGNGSNGQVRIVHQ
jgi:hypothetical protein